MTNTKVLFTVSLDGKRESAEEVIYLNNIGLYLSDYETKEEMEDVINEEYDTWVENNINVGWELKGQDAVFSVSIGYSGKGITEIVELDVPVENYKNDTELEAGIREELTGWLRDNLKQQWEWVN